MNITAAQASALALAVSLSPESRQRQRVHLGAMAGMTERPMSSQALTTAMGHLGLNTADLASYATLVAALMELELNAMAAWVGINGIELGIAQLEANR